MSPGHGRFCQVSGFCTKIRQNCLCVLCIVLWHRKENIFSSTNGENRETDTCNPVKLQVVQLLLSTNTNIHQVDSEAFLKSKHGKKSDLVMVSGYSDFHGVVVLC